MIAVPLGAAFVLPIIAKVLKNDWLADLIAAVVSLFLFGMSVHLLFGQDVVYGYLFLLRRLVPGVMPRICLFNVWITRFGKPQYSVFSFSPLMIDRLSRHHIEIVNMEPYNAKNSVGF